MPKILVILGPTATGKTDLALKLAKKFNGELIACDSRQVYKGLDIGTGKYPGKLIKNERIEKSAGFWKIDGIKVWLYDVVDPTKQFNAFDFANKATEVIKDIWQKKKLPIIVGGTGLYLRVLLKGVDSTTGADQKLRTELSKLELVKLQNRVEVLSPTKWKNLNNSDKNNPRRLIRIIEQLSMYPYINTNNLTSKFLSNAEILKIGLTTPRPILNSKINQRVFDWINLGILEEVKKLIKSGVPQSKFRDFGLEYGLVAGFLRGEIASQQELVNLMQIKTRQYAKRQMTWFKKDKEIVWFDVSTPKWEVKVESEVSNWYNAPK